LRGQNGSVLTNCGGSFAWQTAVRAFKERYYPDSLSTDLHAASMNAGMKDMTNVMSKFLALGMPLEDVIVRSTLNPAKEIKLEQLGNLSVGAPADVAVLRLETGKFGFLDQRGGRQDGTQKLGCELTLRDAPWSTTSMASPPSRGRRCRRLRRAGRPLSARSEGKEAGLMRHWCA
jgi:dihydroorotase